MAALHEALKSLGPTSWSSVPTDLESVTAYLQNAFESAQTIIDSVPLPPPQPTDTPIGRSRSSTSASGACNVSEISSSSARSEPFDLSHAALQKEWGKPIKLSAKDNPLDISVYKLGAKDSRGAWFARKSVHEGLSFKKWKLGLQREFPETMQVQGGPGEGNIRGIGGERRVERVIVEGAGSVEVYHLSAQFPGPTTPRDFVTLLHTSSSAIKKDARQSISATSNQGQSGSVPFSDTPKHFMVISKPCLHPDASPRDGFIRGQYESVEFIRQLPKKSTMSASATDLMKYGKSSSWLEKEELLRNAMKEAGIPCESLHDKVASVPAEEGTVKEARQRGKTISFAGSRGAGAKGEKVDSAQDGSDDDDEMDPVEWIMVTRSDPGGSVPRFMVERGTPAGIVGDASKFLDWACKKEHSENDIMALEKGIVKEITETHPEVGKESATGVELADLRQTASPTEDSKAPPLVADKKGSKQPTIPQPKSEGLMASMASAAVSNIEAYAPQAVIDRLPGHQPPDATTSHTNMQRSQSEDGADVPQEASPARSPSSSSSNGSFASAEDRLDDATSDQHLTSPPRSFSKDKLSAQDRELAKHTERRRVLDEKLTKAREKQSKDKQELSTKEQERIRKAEEKHAREVAKQEERYRKEVAKLEAKQQREDAKGVEMAKKAEDKDEKTRLRKENDALNRQLTSVTIGRDYYKNQVSRLHTENNRLIYQLGKLDGGQDVLKEMRVDRAVSASEAAMPEPESDEARLMRKFFV